MKIEEIASRLATIKKSLQATDLHTLTLRVEEVENLIEEYTSQLWTSPCICPTDEKTGETLCCNHCGKPTARTESKELPGDDKVNNQSKVSCKGNSHAMRYHHMLEQFRDGAKWMRSIASPLLASKDARIRELEEANKLAEIKIAELIELNLTPPKN